MDPDTSGQLTILRAEPFHGMNNGDMFFINTLDRRIYKVVGATSILIGNYAVCIDLCRFREEDTDPLFWEMIAPRKTALDGFRLYRNISTLTQKELHVQRIDIAIEEILLRIRSQKTELEWKQRQCLMIIDETPHCSSLYSRNSSWSRIDT